MSARTSTRTAAVAVTSTLALAVVPLVALAPEAGAAETTTLTVRTNKTTFVAGSKIVIAAHLSIAKAGVPLTFYEKLPGRSAKVIFTGKTDASGDDAIEGKSRYNATYVVRYAGSANYTASRGTASVKVKVKMSTQLRGGFKTSGAYRVYHATTKGTFVVGVSPSKHGNRVRYFLQYRSGGTWKNLDNATYTLNKDSVAGGTFKGIAGRKYRLKATWSGDKLNLANHTVYRYAQFVR